MRRRATYSGALCTGPPTRNGVATPAYITCIVSPAARVAEVVAVIHPDARVVGTKRNHVPHARVDLERVGPPRTAAVGDAVPAQHQHVVAVQVHRVDGVRVVDDRHLHEVTETDHEHRHVRIEVPVQRPVEAGPAVLEAELSLNPQREGAIEVRRGRKRCGCRRPVVERVEVGPGRVGKRPRRAPVGVERERGVRREQLEPHRLPRHVNPRS